MHGAVHPGAQGADAGSWMQGVQRATAALPATVGGERGRAVIAGLLAICSVGSLSWLVVAYFYLGPDWLPVIVPAIDVLSVLFAVAFAILVRSTG